MVCPAGSLDKLLTLWSDRDVSEVTPIWKVDPHKLLVEGKAMYDVKAVPLSSIALVTNKVIKVRDCNFDLGVLLTYSRSMST